MSVSELLPCPMCGSLATLYNAVQDACIRCDGCRLTIRCDHDRATDKVAHDWLAAAWNRRPPATYQPNINSGEVDNATPPAQAAESRAEAARDFPANTCPASRHVQLIAERIKGGAFRPEPYMADSLFTVVAELWEARAAIAAMPASGEGVDAARYRWLRDSPAAGVEIMTPDGLRCLNGPKLDAAIDAARGEG